MNIQLLFIEFTVLKKINENVKQKLNTILFIGDTGSGKSFIFNWVSGAKFEYSNGELKLIQSMEQNFSAQSNAMQSVTYIPNFNKIDEDYLIIDFPGFKDTKGKYSQLSIKLMFDEIVTKTNVKIVVVLPQPTTKLEERGAHIQDLIKSAFTSQNTKFDSIGLIINQFQEFPLKESQDEQTAIQEIQEQLKKKSQSDKEYAHIYQALSKQIIIMEDVYDENIVDVLSENARQSVISRLKQISPISYQPDYQDENQVVSSYIKSQLQKIFTSFQRILQKQKEDAKSKGGEQFIKTLQDLIKQLNEISQNDCDPQTQLIKHFISKIEQGKDKQESQEKFLQIYSYFFKYKESISGYQYFEENQKQLKKRIKQFIDEIQEELKRQEEIKKLEKQKLDEINAKHEREVEKKQIQMEQEQQRFEQRLKEKEKNDLQNQLKEKDLLILSKEDQLNKTNQQLEQKIKDQDKILQEKILENQKINEENEKKKIQKESNRQQLRAEIDKAQIEIKYQEKQIQDYLDDQNKKYRILFQRDSEEDQNKKLKPFKDKILELQKIIDLSKNELFYQD